MRQKPKLNEDKEIIYPHYGSMMHTCASSASIKTTHICPIEGCNYTARFWSNRWGNRQVHKDSTGSKFCPKHQQRLLDVGMVMRIPKGQKRIRFLKELRNADIIKLRNKDNLTKK